MKYQVKIEFSLPQDGDQITELIQVATDLKMTEKVINSALPMLESCDFLIITIDKIN